MKNIQVIDHPLVAHKVSYIRDQNTAPHVFRSLIHEVSELMCYEVFRDLPMVEKTIATPLTTLQTQVMAKPGPCIVSVLRAGNGMLDGFLRMVPTASVGFIGVYRDAKTLDAVEYYYKMPKDIGERDVIIVDPMLATGHTAVAAVERLIQRSKPKSIRYVSILAAPEGVDYLNSHCPTVEIYLAALDDGLNEHSYIVPGLGDAGDRIFNT